MSSSQYSRQCGQSRPSSLSASAADRHRTRPQAVPDSGCVRLRHCAIATANKRRQGALHAATPQSSPPPTSIRPMHESPIWNLTSEPKASDPVCRQPTNSHAECRWGNGRFSRRHLGRNEISETVRVMSASVRAPNCIRRADMPLRSDLSAATSSRARAPAFGRRGALPSHVRSHIRRFSTATQPPQPRCSRDAPVRDITTRPPRGF